MAAFERFGQLEVTAMVVYFSGLPVAFFILFLSTSVSVAQTCRDDASIASLERFSDNGDDTVSDVATGLMWKRCVEGLSGSNCDHGSVGNFTWQQALNVARETDFAGHTDWRLADKNELASIIEYRCYNPAVNLEYFPNTSSLLHWSSSPYVYYPYSAWYVDFGTGSVNGYYKSYGGHVRLVRNSQ